MSTGSPLKLILNSTLLCVTSSAAAGFILTALPMHVSAAGLLVNISISCCLLAYILSYNLISLLLSLAGIEPHPLSAHCLITQLISLNLYVAIREVAHLACVAMTNICFAQIYRVHCI